MKRWPEATIKRGSETLSDPRSPQGRETEHRVAPRRIGVALIGAKRRWEIANHTIGARSDKIRCRVIRWWGSMARFLSSPIKGSWGGAPSRGWRAAIGDEEVIGQACAEENHSSCWSALAEEKPRSQGALARLSVSEAER